MKEIVWGDIITNSSDARPEFVRTCDMVKAVVVQLSASDIINQPLEGYQIPWFGVEAFRLDAGHDYYRASSASPYRRSDLE